jgi:hypothetical protein
VSKKTSDERSDREAERIATDALRVILTTPHTPQREQVGTFGRNSKPKRAQGQSRSKRAKR